MGPIQTALGQMLGALGGAAMVGKNINEDARQAREKETMLAEKADKEKAKEAQKNQVASEAVKLAQEKGIASPSSIIFDYSGKPIGTYEEVAALLAEHKSSARREARLKAKNAIQERIKMLKGKAAVKDEQK